MVATTVGDEEKWWEAGVSRAWAWAGLYIYDSGQCTPVMATADRSGSTKKDV